MVLPDRWRRVIVGRCRRQENGDAGVTVRGGEGARLPDTIDRIPSTGRQRRRGSVRAPLTNCKNWRNATN